MILIILLGAPGVGKGTQSLILSNKLDLEIISTGQILRDITKQSSLLSKSISTVINNGEFITDNTVLKLVEQKLSGTTHNGYILDGYPRNLQQAYTLQKNIVKTFNVYYVFLDLSKNNLFTRLKSRFFCDNCGEVYNKITHMTKIPGRCDICKSISFSERKDDIFSTIDVRIEKYYTLTFPLITFFSNKKNFIKIDARYNKYEISGRIIRFLGL